MAQHRIASGGRYPVLRTIAILWLVGAVLAFAYGVYRAALAVKGGSDPDLGSLGGGRFTASIIWLAATFFMVIFNVAVAELIKLAMDIEHNTRATALNSSSPVVGESISTRVGNSKEVDEESAEAALIRGH